MNGMIHPFQPGTLSRRDWRIKCTNQNSKYVQEVQAEANCTCWSAANCFDPNSLLWSLIRTLISQKSMGSRGLSKSQTGFQLFRMSIVGFGVCFQTPFLLIGFTCVRWSVLGIFGVLIEQDVWAQLEEHTFYTGPGASTNHPRHQLLAAFVQRVWWYLEKVSSTHGQQQVLVTAHCNF